MKAPDTRSLYRSEEGHRAMMGWYDAEFERLSSEVPLETRFIETRFGPTHVVFAGDEAAPPLVMIQGLGGNAMMLQSQFRALAPHFRLVVPDVPGQPGKSAPARIPHTRDHFAHWLTDVLDVLRFPQVDILGVSLGGRIVLKFGAYCPERVGKAVLISPTGLKTLRLDIARRAIGIALGSAASRGGVFQGMLDILLTGSADRPDPDLSHLIEEFHLFFKHFKQELFTGMPMAVPLPKGELQRFEPSAMLLAGEEESLFDPRAAIEKAKRLLPNLEEAHLVSKAGHIMHYERPDVVNQYVLDYLRGSKVS
jgi:pimeloyl-ACP methyl ester carboxylesterase